MGQRELTGGSHPSESRYGPAPPRGGGGGGGGGVWHGGGQCVPERSP